MVRVGLITTSWTGHRCGVAEYSRMLIERLPGDIQVTPIFGPYEFASLYPRVMAGNFDVIHFNYDSGFLGIFAPGVANRFRAGGAGIVLTLSDHHPRNNRAIFAFTNEFDKIVVHQETNEGFEFIPIGIDVMADSPWKPTNSGIGTCGFPLPQKGILLVPQAARLLNMPCTMVCPESQHIDTHAIGRQVKTIWPQTDYITEFRPQPEVQRIMALNLVNVFPMRDGKSGISSSVRMGIAGGSHIVLSHSWMFRDIFEDDRYNQEVEWIEGEANNATPELVAEAITRVIANGKRPSNMLRDWSWNDSAERYAQLYRAIAKNGVPCA
jgi:glycosyltransferase involved in cell wall biosynthesis